MSIFKTLKALIPPLKFINFQAFQGPMGSLKTGFKKRGGGHVRGVLAFMV